MSTVTNKLTKNILIVAGEPSGDLHAAKLVKCTKEKYPKINFIGMGGKLMREAGVKLIVDSNKLAVMGLFDAIFKFRKIHQAYQKIKKQILNKKPNLVILVDYPGFNLAIAKLAKKHQCRVAYYIPPKLWASRPHRAKKIRKYVDELLVIFPFEVEFFKTLGIKAKFVGNELVNEAKPTLSIIDAKRKFGLENNSLIIGLFPGSRQGELKRLLPVMLNAAILLQEKHKNIEFVIPLASSFSRQDIEPFLINSKLKVTILDDNIYDIINVCDAIIAVSGTVTLQIGLMSKPMVVIYKISPEFIPIRKFINIKWIGLCNIVLQKGVIKELLQRDASPDDIYQEIDKILSDKEYRHTMIAQLQNVRKKFVAVEKYDLTEIIAH
ncbi:MAG: lipid-A-disaccharide synthase [Gammaproteobacteria bacterium]|nr:lipid-A-disaccharide synthase [Gammaproteobacteria bacterium]